MTKREAGDKLLQLLNAGQLQLSSPIPQVEWHDYNWLDNVADAYWIRWYVDDEDLGLLKQIVEALFKSPTYVTDFATGKLMLPSFGEDADDPIYGFHFHYTIENL